MLSEKKHPCLQEKDYSLLYLNQVAGSQSDDLGFEKVCFQKNGITFIQARRSADIIFTLKLQMFL